MFLPVRRDTPWDWKSYSHERVIVIGIIGVVMSMYITLPPVSQSIPKRTREQARMFLPCHHVNSLNPCAFHLNKNKTRCGTRRFLGTDAADGVLGASH